MLQLSKLTQISHKISIQNSNQTLNSKEIIHFCSLLAILDQYFTILMLLRTKNNYPKNSYHSHHNVHYLHILHSYSYYP